VYSVFFIVCVRSSFVFCVLFERDVSFFVVCVICVLCLIVISLPPGKNPFAKLNSVVLVRKRTIPTERPQPADEVSANFS
jgi:hypothetical protein